MADEALATIARGLAKDMAEAGEEGTESVAGFTETTAQKAERSGQNLSDAGRRELDGAQRLMDLIENPEQAPNELNPRKVPGGHAGLPEDPANPLLGGADGEAGKFWGTDGGTTLTGLPYLTPRTDGIKAAINPGGGRMNCGPVAMAVDALLAEGKPVAVDAADHPMTRDEVAAAMGKTWARKSGLSWLVDDMIKAGPGARAIVGAWPNAGLGHFFNVINDDGKIVFIDGQIGVAKHVGRWREYWILRTN